MTDQPNIILIITDQQRFDTIGALGASWMHTPNLDRLAREGLSFSNCYVTAPLCAPSRASLFTGMYPHAHGVYSNFQKWAPTWVQWLADAGYHCVNIGKMHTNPYDIPGGFHQRIVVENKDRPLFLDEHERAYYDDWDRALHARGIEKPTRYVRHRNDPAGYDNAMGAFVWEHDDDMHSDNFVGDTANWWLQERQSEAPLFLQIGFPGPHPPFDPTASALKHYQDVDIPIPNVSVEELAAQPPAHAAYRDVMVKYNQDGVAWKHNPDPETLRRVRRHYAANITMIDAKIGALLDTLEQRGALDNTLVIFTSDHGEALGDHGHIQKWTMYDVAVKVPLILWAPGRVRQGVTDALVQLMDVAPTILDQVAIPVPVGWQARSFSTLLDDPEAPTIRDAVYAELTRGHIQTESEFICMRRDRRYKLVWYLGEQVGELYDLETDPDELINLWDCPGHAAIRAQRVALIQEEMIRNMVHAQSRPMEKPQPYMETK
jgi:arylsulfatase